MKPSTVFFLASFATTGAVCHGRSEQQDPNERSDRGRRPLGTDVVDVCVVGASPSGVQAAYAAEEGGLTTALFERESYMGGKAKAVFASGAALPYFVGAALYLSSKDESIQHLFDKFGIPLLPLGDPERTLHLGVDEGSAVVPAPEPTQEMADGIAKYVAIRSGLADIDGPKGFLSNYDPSLNDSMLKWLQDNGLLVLFPLFWFRCATYGYGHPKDIPAIYFLKYLDGKSFVDFNNIMYPSSHGIRHALFQKLLEAMVSSLDGSLFLGATIENVAYGSDFNAIEYSVDGGRRRTMKCGSIVIAFAPTAGAMESFTPPTDREALTGLFEEVRTLHYYSILYRDKEAHYAAGASASLRAPKISGIPEDPGENLLYFKQQPFPQSSVSAYYPRPSPKTDEEVRAESLRGYGSKINRTVTEDLIEDFNSWESYFPHVSKESLNGGFYQRFSDIQGRGNQYYVGGLFNFETVQTSMAHARSIVEEHLSPPARSCQPPPDPPWFNLFECANHDGDSFGSSRFKKNNYYLSN